MKASPYSAHILVAYTIHNLIKNFKAADLQLLAANWEQYYQNLQIAAGKWK